MFEVGCVDVSEEGGDLVVVGVVGLVVVVEVFLENAKINLVVLGMFLLVLSAFLYELFEVLKVLLLEFALLVLDDFLPVFEESVLPV